MARIRTIKPSFFKSEDVSVLPLRARLTWVGLWTHADDAGRSKDNARLIKGEVWPLDDVSLEDIEEDLAALAETGRIVRYEVGGKRYLEIVNWLDHQRIQKPSASKIPPPPETTTGPFPPGSRKGDGCLSELSDMDSGGKGRERKGREGTREARKPSPRCAQHATNPSPGPCGPCKGARLELEQWEAEQADHERDRKAAIRGCRLCDGDGYRFEHGRRIVISPYEPCDHRPLRSVS